MLDEYLGLLQRIKDADFSYHSLDKISDLDDDEYDTLVVRLKEIETTYPEYKEEHNPDEKVGGLSGEIKHTHPMLSLDKATDYSMFVKAMGKLNVGKKTGYSCELKLDGVACELIYKHGVFTQAVTRGDGHYGHDITHNILLINNVPKLLTDTTKADLRIRGEVVINNEYFKRISYFLTKDELISPRNIVSGFLGRKPLEATNVVPEERMGKSISFLPYGAVGLEQETQYEVLVKVEELGFTLAPESKVLFGLEEVVSEFNRLLSYKDKLPFATDGYVIKVNNIRLQETLGYATKFPKWAFAYKWPNETGLAKVNSIEWQLSKSGTINPVALITGLEDNLIIAGTIIRRVNAINHSTVVKLNLKIGDTLLISKAGGVIPKINKVTNSAKGKIKIPEVCPSCGSKTIVNGKVLMCSTKDSCPGVRTANLISSLSRKGIYIPRVDKKSLKTLVETGLVNDLLDFFSLSKTILAKTTLTINATDTLLSKIERYKEVSLSKFIYALQIDDVGLTLSTNLAKRLGDVNVFINSDKNSLNSALENLGNKERAIDSIVTYLAANKERLIGLSKILKITN